MPQHKMEQNEGEWLFTDRYGSIWRLIPTGDPDMPFQIVLESREHYGT